MSSYNPNGCCTREKVLLKKPPRELNENLYDALIVKQTKNRTKMDWYKNGIKVESWDNFEDKDISLEISDYEKLTVYNNKKKIIFEGDMNTVELIS